MTIWLALCLLAFFVVPASADCATCHYATPPTRFNVLPSVLVTFGLTAPVPLVLPDPVTGTDPVGGGDTPIDPTPEPATLVLVGTSLAALGWVLRPRPTK